MLKEEVCPNSDKHRHDNLTTNRVTIPQPSAYRRHYQGGETMCELDKNTLIIKIDHSH